MSRQHSPGPWNATLADDDDGPIDSVLVRVRFPNQLIRRFHAVNRLQEDEANVHLIQAIPSFIDAVDALRELLAILSAGGHPNETLRARAQAAQVTLLPVLPPLSNSHID